MDGKARGEVVATLTLYMDAIVFASPSSSSVACNSVVWYDKRKFGISGGVRVEKGFDWRISFGDRQHLGFSCHFCCGEQSGFSVADPSREVLDHGSGDESDTCISFIYRTYHFRNLYDGNGILQERPMR